MMEKLWGDNFFDPASKKWTKKQTDSPTCKRGFVQFVYEPIKGIIEAAMNDNKTKLFAMCDKLGIAGKVKAEDREKTGKPLMKAIMQAWLPAHSVGALVPGARACDPAAAAARPMELWCTTPCRMGPTAHCQHAPPGPALRQRQRAQLGGGGSAGAAGDDDLAPALPRRGPEVQGGEPVRGAPGRPVRDGHPQLRRGRAPDAVRVQDDPRLRQGALLRLWPRLRWQGARTLASLHRALPLTGHAPAHLAAVRWQGCGWGAGCSSGCRDCACSSCCEGCQLPGDAASVCCRGCSVQLLR